MGKGLSRAKVLAAAVDAIDERGLDTLTMKAVADRLGVEAMSLYRHVKNKADLLDGVHDHLLGQLAVPDGDGWQPRVQALAMAFRALLFAHPRAVPLLASRAATTPQAVALVEAGVGLLTEAGWSEDDAIVAFQTVFCFCVGHALFHTAGGQDVPNDGWARLEFEGGLAAILRGLEASAP